MEMPRAFTQLAAWGYGFSDVEQLVVVVKHPAPNTEPADDAPVEDFVEAESEVQPLE